MEGLKSIYEIFAFVFGSIFGSFLNVLIYRLPRDMDIVFLPSHCPHCKRKILWYHNIPIVSYIFLGGKCAYCGAKISPRYPFVELLSALNLLYLYNQFGISLELAFYFIVSSSFIVMLFTDLETRILPDELTIGGTLLSILWSFKKGGITPLSSIFGAFSGFLMLFFVWFFYKKLKGEEGMGFGDIKLIAMIGALLGITKTLLLLVLSSFSALILGGLYMVLSKKDKKYELPFGSFMSFWAMVFLYWGKSIYTFYISFFR